MEPVISPVAAPPQTGVQILFAFLLTLVLQQRFAGITEAQPRTYVVTLLLSVVTAGLLVAPAAVDRVTFQRGLKPSRRAMVGIVSMIPWRRWSYPHARAASSL